MALAFCQKSWNIIMFIPKCDVSVNGEGLRCEKQWEALTRICVQSFYRADSAQDADRTSSGAAHLLQEAFSIFHANAKSNVTFYVWVCVDMQSHSLLHKKPNANVVYFRCIQGK